MGREASRCNDALLGVYRQIRREFANQAEWRAVTAACLDYRDGRRERRLQGVTARTATLRGWPIRRAISPKHSPALTAPSRSPAAPMASNSPLQTT